MVVGYDLLGVPTKKRVAEDVDPYKQKHTVGYDLLGVPKKTGRRGRRPLQYKNGAEIRAVLVNQSIQSYALFFSLI